MRWLRTELGFGNSQAWWDQQSGRRNLAKLKKVRLETRVTEEQELPRGHLE